IGDVLRSDDLASTAIRDAAFLATLRVRLSAEPTVFAPQPAVEADTALARPGVAQVAARGRAQRRSWRTPSAVAAGFVLVAGAVMVTRAPTTGTGQRDGAVVAAGGVAPVAVAGSGQGLTDAVAVARTRGPLIRDARLDRYLAAHQQFAGTSVLGVPSGFLRNAAADAPNR
ncbi:MAG TPA: anti-sigma 24 factor, partial [Albitalea sp.]|nr:anti-sigma 24 factor [Albitalea sp.]